MSKHGNQPSVAARLKKRGIDEWEIKSAADSLIRAEEIKKDKDLMTKVDEELDKRRDALKAIG